MTVYQTLSLSIAFFFLLANHFGENDHVCSGNTPNKEFFFVFAFFRQCTKAPYTAIPF